MQASLRQAVPEDLSEKFPGTKVGDRPSPRHSCPASAKLFGVRRQVCIHRFRPWSRDSSRSHSNIGLIKCPPPWFGAIHFTGAANVTIHSSSWDRGSWTRFTKIHNHPGTVCSPLRTLAQRLTSAGTNLGYGTPPQARGNKQAGLHPWLFRPHPLPAPTRDVGSSSSPSGERAQVNIAS
jgi:hypothetical protein